MRFASPLRMRSMESMIASFPVLQADELDVTWLPRASNPAILALVELFMTIWTMVLPMRRIWFALTFGTTSPAMVSMPPIPEPMMAPVSQLTSVLSGFGTVKPASRQASIAAMPAYPMLSFTERRSSASKYRPRSSS